MIFLQILSQVQILTPKNLKDSLPILVAFIDDKETSTKVQNIFSEMDQVYNASNLGILNCVAFKEFCEHMKMQEYPMISMLTNKTAYQYFGPVDQSAIEQWASSMLKPFFIDAESKKFFHEMMEHNKISIYFIASGPSADAIESELNAMKGRTYMAYFKADNFSMKAFRSSMTFDFVNKTNLVKFVRDHSTPPFVKLTQQNFQEVVGEGKTLAIYASNLNETEKPVIQSMKKEVLKRIQAETAPDYTFAYMNFTQYADFLRQFETETPFMVLLQPRYKQNWLYQVKKVNTSFEEQMTVGEWKELIEGENQNGLKAKMDLAVLYVKISVITIAVIVIVHKLTNIQRMKREIEDKDEEKTECADCKGECEKKKDEQISSSHFSHHTDMEDK
ncbi:Protein_disulfide isomerase PDI2 [Hexamita inflata]|uniref:Protein disulfide isomerase PDI2 n=1 Tax=Hexamita inflata TaxID=28002 RepID=A0AA86NP73_9EUKA|nr:Protein disulfide isomerase PDI2 [Hexamita inflata]